MTTADHLKLDARFVYVAAELELLAAEVKRAGIGLEVHCELANAQHHLRTARANFRKSKQPKK